jgi:putative ABC transport system permease protein
VDEELAYHIEMRTRDYVQDGFAPPDARRAAMARFGNYDRTRRQCHDLYMVTPTTSGDRFMTQLIQDLRYALRSIRKAPLFAVVVVLTLALGIGANSALFSVVDGVLLRPLPYHDPDQLVRLWENDRLRGTTIEGFSGPDYFDLVERSDAFTSLAAIQTSTLTLTGANNEPQDVVVTRSSHTLLSMLGVTPMLGRGPGPQEDEPGGNRVVVLSHQFWMSYFGGDERVVGRTITLQGLPYEVIGVMPPSFSFPAPTVAMWSTLQIGPTTTSRGNHGFGVVGRLRRDVSLEQANAQVTTVASALEHAYADDNLGRGMWVQTVSDWLVGNVRTPLYILLGAVGFVLLIACANVANLMFARAAMREREVAIRIVMGAGRARLFRQVVTESVVLSGLSAVVGFALAFAGVRALIALAPAGLPRLEDVGIDVRVLGFTLAIGLLTGLVFGTLPALQAARGDLQQPLREGTRTSGSGVKLRLRKILVISEVGLAVVLVTGAGLLIKSFWRLLQVDPGFDPTQVVQVSMQLPAARYPQDFGEWPHWGAVRQFQVALLERIEGIPGVSSAALALNSPVAAGWTTRFQIEGRPVVPEGEMDEVRIRVVTPDYFRTLSIPIVRGRGLTELDDRTDARPVILINESFARRYFTDEDPIGQHVTNWGVTREIVGMVKDVKFLGLDQDVPPAIYPTFSQMPFTGFSILARATGSAESIGREIRDRVWAIDRDLAMSTPATLESDLSASVAQPKFNMLLLSVFAGIALVIAAVGIYGVMAFGVNQRRREIGVRLSLGAQGRDVLKEVLVEGLRFTAIGIVIGAAGAAFLTRLMTSLLFGVAALDIPTFGAVALVAALIAILASYVPARRASRVNPIVALRYE